MGQDALPPSLRNLATDGGWVLAGMVFCFFGSRGANETFDHSRMLDAVGWMLVLLTPAVLLGARPRTRTTLLATAVLVSIYLARDYAPGPVYLTVVAAATITGFRLPFAQSWPPVAVSGVLLVAASALHLDSDSTTTSALTVFTWLAASFTPWAVAALVRMNRASARQAVAERERHDRDTERVRIAREVHDVVGHSLAVISMQAGVALHVHERRPEQARVALDAIARSSHDALDELRRTLAVLRGDATAPEPGLADLAELADGFVAGGQQVQLSVRGVRPAPGSRAAHETAAYRIVQESLTNTVRHAAAAPVRIEIACTPAGLAVDVLDDGPSLVHRPGARSGSGLAGMRDRVRSLGGTVEAGPGPDGGWRVHADLPFGGRP